MPQSTRFLQQLSYRCCRQERRHFSAMQQPAEFTTHRLALVGQEFNVNLFQRGAAKTKHKTLKRDSYQRLKLIHILLNDENLTILQQAGIGVWYFSHARQTRAEFWPKYKEKCNKIMKNVKHARSLVSEKNAADKTETAQYDDCSEV